MDLFTGRRRKSGTGTLSYKPDEKWNSSAEVMKISHRVDTRCSSQVSRGALMRKVLGKPLFITTRVGKQHSYY